MDKARKAGLDGATIFQALEGYGYSGKLHRTHLFAEDAPLNLVIVDTPERIDAFIESVHELLEGVSFMLSPVDVIDF
jgi:PII-like signaling protein